MSHPYSTESVVRIFFAEIFRLHSVPTSISDRSPVFTFAFWQVLFGCSRRRAHETGFTSLVRQLDGGGQQDRDVPLVHDQRSASKTEHIYNTSFHVALKETQPKLLYGHDTPPASLLSYKAVNVHDAAVAPQTLAECAEFLEDVRF